MWKHSDYVREFIHKWPDAVTLKVYLKEPGDQPAIAWLFAMHERHFAASGAFYVGAASMGINGYRFWLRDREAAGAMRADLVNGGLCDKVTIEKGAT